MFLYIKWFYNIRSIQFKNTWIDEANHDIKLYDSLLFLAIYLSYMWQHPFVSFNSDIADIEGFDDK